MPEHWTASGSRVSGHGYLEPMKHDRETKISRKALSKSLVKRKRSYSSTEAFLCEGASAQPSSARQRQLFRYTILSSIHALQQLLPSCLDSIDAVPAFNPVRGMTLKKWLRHGSVKGKNSTGELQTFLSHPNESKGVGIVFCWW
jgi:hypothetical protein